nr:thioredoxin domain-containing protein [Campylobacterota bacterium]
LDKMSENQLFYSNMLKKDDGSHFIDTKVVTSFNAMMIDTLFHLSQIEEHYLKIAIDSLETLLDNYYIHQELYHTQDIKAFLEDYAYLGTTLLNAYTVTNNQKYLILAESIANQSIDKFYEYGKWKFSNGDVSVYDDIYDLLYPSAMATMLLFIHRLSFYVDSDYNQFVFKTLELNSYNLMRQPLSSPKMSKVLLRHLKKMI